MKYDRYIYVAGHLVCAVTSSSSKRNRTWKMKSELHFCCTFTNPAYQTFETKAFGWLACISAGSFLRFQRESRLASFCRSLEGCSQACMHERGLERQKKKIQPRQVPTPAQSHAPCSRAVTFLRFGIRIVLLSHAFCPHFADASPPFPESRLC